MWEPDVGDLIQGRHKGNPQGDGEEAQEEDNNGAVDQVEQVRGVWERRLKMKLSGFLICLDVLSEDLHN